MGNEQEASTKEAGKQLYAFVLGEMKAGADQAHIAQKLVDRGVEKTAAAEMAGKSYCAILQEAQEQRYTGKSLIPALIGGALAAAVGGGVGA